MDKRARELRSLGLRVIRVEFFVMLWALVILLLAVAALAFGILAVRRTGALADAIREQRQTPSRVWETVAGPVGALVGRILDAPGAGDRGRRPPGRR